MLAPDDEKRPRVTRYIVAAYASALMAAIIAAFFWFWITHHHGQRGERLPLVLFLYGVLFFASVVAGLAGVFSMVGIRSWRLAGFILPGALFGIAVTGINAFYCILAYALEGMNLGG